jgi:WD40 repeat protein
MVLCSAIILALTIPVAIGCYLRYRYDTESVSYERKPTILATLCQGEPGFVHALAVSPDGSMIAWSVATIRQPPQYSIKVWNWRKEESIVCLQQPTDVYGLAFAPDGRQLASGGDYVVRLWDTGRWQTRTTIPVHAHFPAPLAFSPNGKLLAVGGGADDNVVLWNLSPPVPHVRLPGHGIGVSDLAFSPKNDLIVTAGVRGPIYLWSVHDGAAIATIPFSLQGKPEMYGFNAVAFAPDSQSFAYLGADRTLRTCVVGQQPTERVVPVPSAELISLAYSPDGKHWIVGCGDSLKRPGQVQVWDVTRAVLTASVTVEVGPVKFVRFLPHLPYLVVATTGPRHSVAIWDSTPLIEDNRDEEKDS